EEAVAESDDPMQVVDQMKSLCRNRDDWSGLLDALLREVSLHIAPPGVDFALPDVLTLATDSIPKDRKVPVRQTIREMADVLSLKLDALSEAWALYGKVLDLSPEEPYALERRIELGRSL